MGRIPLILLHHCGGSARDFDALAQALPDFVEPVALDLPGRGRHTAREPLTTARQALDDLTGQLAGLDGDFAVFGHGLGAYLGIGLTSVLENTSSARCVSFFSSGAVAPYAAPPLFRDSCALAAAEADVLRAARLIRAAAPDPAAGPAPRARALRVLRADLAVHDSYVRQLGRTVIESNITVFPSDGECPPRPGQLDRWGATSTESVQISRLAGAPAPHLGHPDRVAQEVARLLPLHMALGGLSPQLTAD